MFLANIVAGMGQRILFPKVTLVSGNTYTVQAPPNANIFPAGWFQLFALEDSVPSVSQYARCGGDPGKLGNWPVFADFTVPGI